MTGIPYLRAGAYVAAVAAIAFACWWVVDRLEERGRVQGRAEVQGRWDAAKERQRAVDAAETERRRKELKEITDAAQAQAARDRAAVDRARAVGDGLQRAFAATLARCGDPASAKGSSAAPGAGNLLADVQRRIDEAAGELAAVATERGRAGSVCERTYDSLTQP